MIALTLSQCRDACEKCVLDVERPKSSAEVNDLKVR